MAKAPSKKRSLLTGKVATVWVERNGVGLKMEDVPANQAPLILADLLGAFRALERTYPELVADLSPVPGGTPVDVVDDDYAWEDGKRRRKVGF